jgi:hypothetical protein
MEDGHEIGEDQIDLTNNESLPRDDEDDDDDDDDNDDDDNDG